jgi:flagellar protein FliS
MATQRFQQYQNSAVTQADPVRLVGMLYEGAARFMHRALKAIEEGDAEGSHNSIMRAYAIIAELQATLDFEQGGEIAPRLEQIYDYILHLLKEANMAKDGARVREALGLTGQLGSAWAEAFRHGRSGVSISELPPLPGTGPDKPESDSPAIPRGGFSLEI